ncbi:hypothetical protein ACWC0C_42720 [Streptomyces sp. NPDC001709]
MLTEVPCMLEAANPSGDIHVATDNLVLTDRIAADEGEPAMARQ